MEKYDVFISYSRKDSKIVDDICKSFDTLGITYFIDKQGISGGYEFPKVLANAIINSRLFLFIASKNSYESKFTNSEITFAFNKKSKDTIIPYIIDNSTLPIELDFVFSSINRRCIEEHPINSVLANDILVLLNRKVTEDSKPIKNKINYLKRVAKYLLASFSLIAISLAIWADNSNQVDKFEWLGYLLIFAFFLSFILGIIGLTKPTSIDCSDRKEIILLIIIPTILFLGAAGCFLPNSETNKSSHLSIKYDCTDEQKNVIDGILRNMVYIQCLTDSFYISRYEVTGFEWETIMGERLGDTFGNYPANNITDESAQLFVKQLSNFSGIEFSIPSTREWIIAARGGDIKSRSIYPGSNVLESVGWYYENSKRNFHPVGTKNPNELGIYDMAGNVWELCYDAATGFCTPRGGSILSEESMCQISDSAGDSIFIEPYECGLRLLIRTDVSLK